jgi:hypothetical protein
VVLMKGSIFFQDHICNPYRESGYHLGSWGIHQDIHETLGMFCGKHGLRMKQGN